MTRPNLMNFLPTWLSMDVLVTGPLRTDWARHNFGGSCWQEGCGGWGLSHLSHGSCLKIGYPNKMGVSWGFLKWRYPQSSSIFIGVSILNHPFCGTPPHGHFHRGEQWSGGHGIFRYIWGFPSKGGPQYSMVAFEKGTSQSKIWMMIWGYPLFQELPHIILCSLVGGLVAIFYFCIYWVANHPKWLSYFSEGWPNHQPVHVEKL